ncbi:MAG: adenine deaminase [Planctomycetota bacterium]
MTDWDRLLAVARADAPADLLLTGGRLINVFTGELEPVDIAICGERIAGVGAGYSAERTIDLGGSYVAPGLIDAHVHIESSLCLPSEFASAVVPRGVTTAVIDPHELANVVGSLGVRYMAEASRGLPMDAVVMAPSCVPATPMATAGGAITADDVRELFDQGVVHGLAEVMDFPGVIGNSSATRAKLDALPGRPADGHCPGVTGPALNAYVAAGIGSDHESVTPDEAREKLARGLFLLIREATNARNLDALLGVVTPANNRRVCFCTDDRTPVDLIEEGSIDHMVRRSIERGVEPIDAIRMATLNPSEWLGLGDLGAVAPGRLANLIVFDDLSSPVARRVYHRGREVAVDGRLTASSATLDVVPPAGRCAVDADAIDLAIPATGHVVRVIGGVADQLTTEHLELPAKVVEGCAVADPSRDLLKIVVAERHRGTGHVGLGFIQGFGLNRGAIAGTVAHDHHNLIAIGADDASIRAAIAEVVAMHGGLACTAGEEVLARLAMPVGGLMSDRPIAEVAEGYRRLVDAARGLGSALADPFMAMSFMGLEVIPKLKLTDRGLVDVERFEPVPLFVDAA